MISEERRKQNRLRILHASTTLFMRQGVSATTIAQIAKASHVVDKTVLNIFGTKDGLMTEVMLHLSQSMTAHIDKLILSKAYLPLTGLERVMFLQAERVRVLQNNPEKFLLLSEVKTVVARNKTGQKIALCYMDNLTYLYRVFGDALDLGMRDGSIRPNLEKDNTLSMLVPIFRAFLQQLALVKLNADFSRLVNVDQEIQMYLDAIFSVLSLEQGKNAQTRDNGPLTVDGTELCGQDHAVPPL